MISIFLLSCFLFIAFFVILKFRGKSSKILREIPGPPGLPVIGNFHEILYKNKEYLNTVITKLSLEHPIYRLTIGPIDMINIVNPEDAEQILTSYKHLKKGKFYSYFNSWLGSGLLTSTGEKWHHRRKLLTPAFHFRILQEFFVIFKEETDKIIEEIKKKSTNENCIDIMPIITQFTLQTIGETAMGFKNFDENSLVIYKKKVSQISQIIVERMTKPWWNFEFIYNFTKTSRKEKKIVELLHKFSQSLIRKRQENRIYHGNRRKKLLDILLEAKEDGAEIDDTGIREEVDTFMFEGHDTTAAALSFILMLLSNNPEHQEKAVEEIKETVGFERALSYSDVQKLPFLERCIREGLRLYPSVPSISRTVGEDFTTNSGYKIPAGSTIILDIFHLHRKSEIYPNPGKFNPDRFLKENSAKRHPCAFLPFSAGPRNCIGQKFAMLELKTFLIGILRKFKMEAVTRQENVKLQQDFVLKSTTPIKIKFTER